jgi:hypothetical protein
MKREKHRGKCPTGCRHRSFAHNYSITTLFNGAFVLSDVTELLLTSSSVTANEENGLTNSLWQDDHRRLTRHNAQMSFSKLKRWPMNPYGSCKHGRRRRRRMKRCPIHLSMARQRKQAARHHHRCVSIDAVDRDEIDWRMRGRQHIEHVRVTCQATSK